MTVEISSLINQYVELLKEAGWIRSGAIEAAFRRVPRHLLIEKIYSGSAQSGILEIDPTNPEHLAMIYSNTALVIRWDPDKPSSSSQPGLMAQMLELLALQPGMRVLEIGAGSGYNAALMAELVSDPSLITTLWNLSPWQGQMNQSVVLARTPGRLTVNSFARLCVYNECQSLLIPSPFGSNSKRQSVSPG
jgi:hypothetical protein